MNIHTFRFLFVFTEFTNANTGIAKGREELQLQSQADKSPFSEKQLQWLMLQLCLVTVRVTKWIECSRLKLACRQICSTSSVVLSVVFMINSRSVPFLQVRLQESFLSTNWGNFLATSVFF